MAIEFYKDLCAAKGAEKLVRECLEQLTNNYIFEDVSNNPEDYYKGDILAIERASGRRIYIEVKDDKRIADTRNILCEDFVRYEFTNTVAAGNMHCDTNIYCVVSQQERKIYVLDFKLLQSNYKKGIYKEIPHSDQTTLCYLCSLAQVASWGAGIAVINY